MKTADITTEDGKLNPVAVAATQVSLHTNKTEYLIGAPRASGLYKSCMRMHVIGTKKKRIRREFTSLKERIIFGYGNAVHYWIQNTSDVFGDKRYGWWKCLACGNVLYFGPPPHIKLKKFRCPNCKSHGRSIIYEEHSLSLKKPYEVTGHPDMFLKLDGVLHPVELKTIKGDSFSNLLAPLVEHVWQLQTYMWALKQQPIEVRGETFDMTKGYIVYISKVMRPEEFPIKSFTLREDPAIIKRILAKLAIYRDAMKTYPKGLPDRLATCERNQGCYDARSCPVVIDCFSMK